ncbi:MAG: hypothetical protein ACK4NY_22140 [Spirosomataceae bacterium]
MTDIIVETTIYNEVIDYIEADLKYPYKTRYKHILESMLSLSETDVSELIDKYTLNRSYYRSARHFVMNYVSATLIEKEGFTWRIDECGWVKQNEKFEEVKIALGTKNSLQIGKSPKNRFFFGYSINLGGAGGASSVSVYDNSFKSFEEAKQAGLNYLKEGYLKTALTFSEDTTNFNRKIVAEFKKAIDFYLPPVGSQLRLF